MRRSVRGLLALQRVQGQQRGQPRRSSSPSGLRSVVERPMIGFPDTRFFFRISQPPFAPPHHGVGFVVHADFGVFVRQPFEAARYVPRLGWRHSRDRRRRRRAGIIACLRSHASTSELGRSVSAMLLDLRQIDHLAVRADHAEYWKALPQLAGAVHSAFARGRRVRQHYYPSAGTLVFNSPALHGLPQSPEHEFAMNCLYLSGSPSRKS